MHREPDDQPWGERMCYVADPDGNSIMLAQPLPQAGTSSGSAGAGV